MRDTSEFFDADGLLLEHIPSSIFTGDGATRHQVGTCYTDERFTADGCGDVRCRAADASGTTLERDATSTWSWLHFPGKPSEAVRELLKKAGWGWSGKREAWRNNQLAVVPPARVPYVETGVCHYSAERADNLDGRSEKASRVAAQGFQQARAIASNIPMGQPVLVGHHSEQHHRRDLERMDAGMRKSVEFSRKAGQLADKAESSRAHQAYKESAPVITRRLERLRKEVAVLTQEGRILSERQELYLLHVQRQVVRDEESLAAQPALPCDTEAVSPGDIIVIKGWLALVLRVNPKTYTGVIIVGGAAGHDGKWPREELRKVVQRGVVGKEELARVRQMRLPALREYVAGDFRKKFTPPTEKAA